MANEKDLTEKILLDENDVFADIMNVLIFKGKNVVHEEELENAGVVSQIKAEGELHQQERDVAKFWKVANIRIAICGLENQTHQDKDMPLRCIGYDGASYKEQVIQHKRTEKKDSKEKKLPTYPVVTIVLYFGTKHWTAPKSLFECFQTEIPDEFKDFIHDYRINVCEVSFLSKEQISMFKSDFRIVADYFRQKRVNKKYSPDPLTIKHVDKVLKFLEAVTEDKRFANISIPPEIQKGGITMKSFLAIEEEKGRMAERDDNICAMADILTIEELARRFKSTIEHVTALLSSRGITPYTG